MGDGGNDDDDDAKDVEARTLAWTAAGAVGLLALVFVAANSYTDAAVIACGIALPLLRQVIERSERRIQPGRWFAATVSASVFGAWVVGDGATNELTVGAAILLGLDLFAPIAERITRPGVPRREREVVLVGYWLLGTTAVASMTSLCHAIGEAPGVTTNARIAATSTIFVALISLLLEPWDLGGRQILDTPTWARLQAAFSGEPNES